VTTLLSPHELEAALEVRDLSDPADGPHAMQSLLDDVLTALTGAWQCTLDVQRRRPLVSVEDNYDRLGYAAADITRDARYSRYAAETVMLRSHTSAGVPPALRALAAHADDPETDVLLALPGLCYRRDSIDRLHVGTPHQVDLWRIATTGSPGRRLGADDLQQMIETVVDAVLPGARRRTSPAHHPYTTHGLQVDVHTASGWLELAECGLAPSTSSPARGWTRSAPAAWRWAWAWTGHSCCARASTTSAFCARPSRASPPSCSTSPPGDRCRSSRQCAGTCPSSPTPRSMPSFSATPSAPRSARLLTTSSR
jgi:hypothetical protein